MRVPAKQGTSWKPTEKAEWR